MLQLLAVLIGFVAIILLLSLLVTSAAHFTQSMLRLRGRSLELGITELLPVVTSLDMNEAKRVARRILDAPLVDPGRNVLIPPEDPGDELLARFLTWAKGTPRSSITNEELTEAVAVVANAHPKAPPATLPPPAKLTDHDSPEVVQLAKERADRTQAAVKTLCPRVARVSKQRFAFRMRIVSVVWAAVIAIVFQVSTPELLAKLSQNPVELGAANELARRTLAETKLDGTERSETTRAASPRDRGPAEDSIGAPERLENAHASPQDSPSARAAAEKDPVARVSDKDQLLVDLRAAQELAAGPLASLQIAPWSQGMSYFYAEKAVQWRNILGVLITTILLTLGAPFWYQQLKNISGLRDALAVRPPKADGKDAGGAERSEPS